MLLAAGDRTLNGKCPILEINEKSSYLLEGRPELVSRSTTASVLTGARYKFEGVAGEIIRFSSHEKGIQIMNFMSVLSAREIRTMIPKKNDQILNDKEKR
jgi:hypothetical protein